MEKIVVEITPWVPLAYLLNHSLFKECLKIKPLDNYRLSHVSNNKNKVIEFS